MGATEIFLCLFVGHFIAVQSVNEQDDIFPRDFPGFFESIVPFPFKRNFDFTPYDTIFSSWRSRVPDFHMLAELPPIPTVPKVMVFCDEYKLTLLVDKSSHGVTLTGEEIQLGDGCYSNRELPNQFAFTYSLDECGTTRVMQNDLEMFTNSLYLNLKNPPQTWWPMPSTVHISCIPKRSYANTKFVSMAQPESGEIFNIKAMNPSWSSTAESNIYKRGQPVNLQVSAKIRPGQQLFIQSCFVSASPEPQTRPRHAIIMNKGCAAPLGSPHAFIQFVAPNQADVVKFVLNTSYLISELFIHCSVLLTDQGVSFGSKFCNYNVFQSRWEDLGGSAKVCECCSSRCKGLSVKQVPEDNRAIVSTGQLVIVDKDVETTLEPSVPEPQEASSTPIIDSMQSDGAVTEDAIVAGTSIMRSKVSSPPQGVVVVSQDPVARLTIWLPGQVQDIKGSENIGSESEDNLTVQLQANDMVSNDLPEKQLADKEQESLLNTPANKVGDHGFNVLPRVDEIIPPQQEEATTAENSQIKMWLGRFGLSPQETVTPLPDEMTVNVLNQDDFNQVRTELTQRRADAALMHQEETADSAPVVRSKIQFSKDADGSQTLSYEEEVVKQQGGGVIRRFGMDGIKRKQQPTQRGLHSTFFDLLRRMNKVE